MPWITEFDEQNWIPLSIFAQIDFWFDELKTVQVFILAKI